MSHDNAERITQQQHFAPVEAWDAIAADYDRHVAPGEVAIAHAALELARLRAGDRFLDIAAGPGGLSLPAARLGAKVVATDWSPKMIERFVARVRDEGIPDAEGKVMDCHALDFAGNGFDVAGSLFGIMLVPDQAKALREMVRVTKPGGTIAAYAWDMPGGGFPLEPIYSEMRAMGIAPAAPPSPDASRMDALTALWSNAGIGDLATNDIKVQRTFADFDDFWATALLGASMRATVAKMAANEVEVIKGRVRSKLLPDSSGRLTCHARANAIKGIVK